MAQGGLRGPRPPSTAANAPTVLAPARDPVPTPGPPRRRVFISHHSHPTVDPDVNNAKGREGSACLRGLGASVVLKRGSQTDHLKDKPGLATCREVGGAGTLPAMVGLPPMPGLGAKQGCWECRAHPLHKRPGQGEGKMFHSKWRRLWGHWQQGGYSA